MREKWPAHEEHSSLFRKAGGWRIPGLRIGKKPSVFTILCKIVLKIPVLFLLSQLQPMCGPACARMALEAALAMAAGITVAKLLIEAAVAGLGRFEKKAPGRHFNQDGENSADSCTVFETQKRLMI